MPDVTVVLPTYNRAHLVGRAVQSILDQVEPNWECVVVDDGSTDNTREVIGRFQDPRIRYIYQENQKLPAARNKGILVSTSPIITFLDSDDMFLPEKLSLQLEAFRRRPELGMVLSGWVDVDKDGQPIRKFTPWAKNPSLELMDWLVRCPAPPSAIMVRKEWLDVVGGFDPLQHYVEDWDLWLRLSYAGCKMEWVQGSVCLKTVHGDSMIRNVKGMYEGLTRLMHNFFAQPNLSYEIVAMQNVVFARINLNGAARALGIGEPEIARTYLQEAIRLEPALLEGNPPELLSALGSAALSDIVPDQEIYLSSMSKALYGLSPAIKHDMNALRATVLAVAAFDASYNHRKQEARAKAAAALLVDPKWLSNRGLLKILFTG